MSKEENNSPVSEKASDDKIKNLSQNSQALHALMASMTAASYSGPIPHSSELARYEQIVPGSALRIICMAEKQVDYRHRLQEKTLDINTELAHEEVKERKLGQIFAFSITMSAIIGGIVLALFGKPIAGTFFGGAGLSAILCVFYASRIPFFNKKHDNKF